MVRISRRVNIIREALNYFSYRINGISVRNRWNTLMADLFITNDDLRDAANQIIGLEEMLNKRIICDDERFGFFFKQLEPSEGLISRANMLLFVFSSMNPDHLDWDKLKRRGEGYLRHDILLSLLPGGTEFEQDELDYATFFNALYKSSLLPETKLAALDVMLNQKAYLSEIIRLIMPAVELIEGELCRFSPLIDELMDEIEGQSDLGDFFYSKIKTNIDVSQEVEVFPSVFSFASSHLIEISRRKFSLSVGLLILKLLRIKEESVSSDGIIEILKLLSDKSRMEIIEAIGHGRAYGQELANQLDLTTATVYHHLGKLQSAGIIYVETDGPRAYYRLNKKKLNAFISVIAAKLTLQGE